jgi:hypothetical protein
MGKLRLLFWSLMGILLAAAATLAFAKYRTTAAPARAERVPPGDQEIAWFHTATNTATWERFVAGVHHLAHRDEQWSVDDSSAFLDQTTAAPEVVIRRQGSTHSLRFRWYKQSSQMKVEDWVRVLSERDRPPLAIMGGGSSDRAVEVARALEDRPNWNGPRPLLLVTTATANAVPVSGEGYPIRNLMNVYPNRSFRFCFTNRQMADALLDFLWSQDELRPVRPPSAGPGGLSGGPSVLLADERPTITALEWGDDPYSVDLAAQFRVALAASGGHAVPPWQRPPPLFQHKKIESSIGGFQRPNKWEARVAEELLADPPHWPLQRSLPRSGNERALLIVPTVPTAARRVLSTLVGSLPGLGRRLVAVSGDGIAFNNVYRDGDLLWNIGQVPVPLVFFTHQNPVAWDSSGSDAQKFVLRPPNGTDDVLHFSDVVRILAEAAFDINPAQGARRELLSNADELRDRLLHRDPAFFDTDGNRKGGQDEYVVWLRPERSPDGVRSGALEVWTRRTSGWEHVARLPVKGPITPEASAR